MYMHWLRFFRLNRKDRLKNMRGTTPEVAMLAHVSESQSANSGVYQHVTAQRALYVGTTFEFSLEQRHDPIST